MVDPGGLEQARLDKEKRERAGQRKMVEEKDEELSSSDDEEENRAEREKRRQAALKEEADQKRTQDALKAELERQRVQEEKRVRDAIKAEEERQKRIQAARLAEQERKDAAKADKKRKEALKALKAAQDKPESETEDNPTDDPDDKQEQELAARARRTRSIEAETSDTLDLYTEDFALTYDDDVVCTNLSMQFGIKKPKEGSEADKMSYVHKLMSSGLLVSKLTRNSLVACCLTISETSIKSYSTNLAKKKFVLPPCSSQGTSTLLPTLVKFAQTQHEAWILGRTVDATNGLRFEADVGRQAHVKDIAVTTNSQFEMAPFDATGGARPTFAILARHMIQYWICHPELNRQKAFDACHAELSEKKPGNLKALQDIIKTHVDGIREDHYAQELLKSLAELEDQVSVSDVSTDGVTTEGTMNAVVKVVRDNIKLRNRILDCLENKGGPPVNFSPKTCPDPLMLFQAWIMPDGGACNSTKEKFRMFLQIFPKRDEDYLLWIEKDEEAKKSKVALKQREDLVKKRKARDDATKARNTKQKLAAKEKNEKKLAEANKKVQAMLRGDGVCKFDSEELADQNFIQRPYLEYELPDRNEKDLPPMIKRPDKKHNLPEGYLQLNENGTYQFDPPGIQWKRLMLESVRILLTVVDNMAVVNDVPLEEFQEEGGTCYCRGKVSLALWNLNMHNNDSPCLEALFDPDLFDEYVEESNSCWMPNLWVEHTKKVFAYFYYYVIGPGYSTPDQREDLLKSFLREMKTVLNEGHVEFMLNLVKELFWADAFCAARYPTLADAKAMHLPCDL
jgi:hypothetical protein